MVTKTTTPITEDRASQLADTLCEILASLDPAESQPGGPTARLDRAVTRWSRGVEAPADVLAVVAQVRARTRHDRTRRHAEVLDRVLMVAVTAVSRSQLRAALTDPLTGLATRARLDDEVQQLIAVSVRGRTPLTAVMLDVDGLKKINDEQGHVAGDAAIAEVGAAIRKHLRRADRSYRFGGDEFALFLPGTTADGARVLVERIQHSCTTAVSVGVATHSGWALDTDVAAWLDRADADLYDRREQERAHRPAALPLRRPFVQAAALALAAAAASGVGVLGVPAALHTFAGGTTIGGTTTGGTAATGRAATAPGPATRPVAPVVRPSAVSSPAARRVVIGRPAPAQVVAVSQPAVPAPVVRRVVVSPHPAPPTVPVAVPTVPPPHGLLTGVLHAVGGVLAAVV